MFITLQQICRYLCPASDAEVAALDDIAALMGFGGFYMFESDGAQIISEPRPAGLGELDDALGDVAKGKWQLLQSELVTNDELVSNKQQMLDGGRAMDEGIGSSDSHSDVDTHSSGESENSHCIDPSDEVVMLSDDAETRGRGRIESPLIRKRAAPDFQPAACSCHAAKMPAGR